MLYSQAWFGRESSIGEEFALHADICNLGSGFLATDYMSFLQNPGFSENLVLFINVNLLAEDF